MVCPRFKHVWYSTYFRPVVCRLLKVVASLTMVKWLCGFLLCILVCVTNPQSRGSLRCAQSHSSGDRCDGCDRCDRCGNGSNASGNGDINGKSSGDSSAIGSAGSNTSTNS